MLLPILAASVLVPASAIHADEVEPWPDLPALVATPTTQGPAAPTCGGHGDVEWFSGTFDELCAAALRDGSLVFLYFSTDWCGRCKRMDRKAFSDAAVVRALRGTLCHAINAETASGRPLARRFAVQSFPALLVLDPDGAPRDRIGGYLESDELLRELERVRKNQQGTVAALRRAADASPETPEPRYALAKKLLSLGDEEGFEREVEVIRAADPEGRTRVSRRIGLDRALAAMDVRYLHSDRDVDALDTTALRAFLAVEPYDDILFEGWDVVARIEAHRARLLDELSRHTEAAEARASSRNAYSRAWPHCPPEHLAEFGNRMSWNLYQSAEELTPLELRLALRVARRASLAAPNAPHVLDTLACCYHVNGEYTRAIEVIRRCIAIDPRNDTWKRRLESFLAEASARHED